MEEKNKITKWVDWVFDKQLPGWFAVIGFLAPPIIALAARYEEIAWDRVGISMAYFVIGIIICRLTTPPLKEGLRPLEYMLCAFGWPLLILMCIIIAIIEVWDHVHRGECEKNEVLVMLLLAFICSMTMNCPNLQNKILTKFGGDDEDEGMESDDADS